MSITLSRETCGSRAYGPASGVEDRRATSFERKRLKRRGGVEEQLGDIGRILGRMRATFVGE